MPNLIVSDIQVRQDAKGRYSLNDLHKAAIATGVTKDIRPNEWMALDQTQGLITALITENSVLSPIESVTGRHGGTYAVKELVYAYAMWISPAFNLKVIRAYDALVTQPQATPAPDPEISATLQAALSYEAHQIASESYSGILEELTERARHYLRTGIPEADILECLKRKCFGRASMIHPKDIKPLLDQAREMFSRLNDLMEGGSELYAKRLL